MVTKHWRSLPITAPLLLFIGLVLVPPLAGGSSITDQVFAIRNVSQVRGIRVNIWTAQQPSNWYAIASPVSICTSTDLCTGSFFETGYVKGTITEPDNILQQYASWTDPDGRTRNVFNLGNLSDNTWYQFQSLYSNSAQRWEAWRGSLVVYYVPYALSFTSGNMVLCGAEGGGTGVPLAVECNNMRYKVGSGSWTQYNYTGVQRTPGYCAYKPYEYGAIVRGPNCE